MASHSGYDYNRRMGQIDRTTGPSLASRIEGGAACLPSPPAARRKNLRLPIERSLVTCHLPAGKQSSCRILAILLQVGKCRYGYEMSRL